MAGLPLAARAQETGRTLPREIQTLIDNHINGFNTQNIDLFLGVFGDTAIIIDGIAPYRWLNPNAPARVRGQLAISTATDVVYVYAPKDFIGIMNTAVKLLSANQRLIESRALRLEWVVKLNSSPPTRQTEPEAVNAPAVQPMNQDAVLMERGRDLLKSGDVASARLVFNSLANAGIADAVLALATTYDPRYLAQHNLIGVAGDETKAHDWYQRASELGSIEAIGLLTYEKWRKDLGSRTSTCRTRWGSGTWRARRVRRHSGDAHGNY